MNRAKMIRWFLLWGLGLAALMFSACSRMGAAAQTAGHSTGTAAGFAQTETARPTQTPTSASTSTSTLTSTAVPASPPTPLPTPTLVPPPCTEAGQTWISPLDGMRLVCVPAGIFLMGSTEEQIDQLLADNPGWIADWFINEKPAHAVYLDAYWMDQTEVTNARYARCVDEGICRAPGTAGSYGQVDYFGNDQFADYPVVAVAWDDAVAYCRWAGRQLPSEAQWEKAARGVDERLYPWGNQLPDSERLNFDGNIGDTTAVGSYPDGASPYGALDMAGNVWEWTADWHDADYYSRQIIWWNPAGPTPIEGEHRVVRGGSWHSDSRFARTAERDPTDPDYRNVVLGFRCLLGTAP